MKYRLAHCITRTIRGLTVQTGAFKTIFYRLNTLFYDFQEYQFLWWFFSLVYPGFIVG